MDLPEPVHDEALVNLYLERISALSVSAFDGADVSDELQQVMTEAVSECDASKSAPAGNNLQVLVARLRDRAAAAEREDQPAVRDTFEQALALAGATAS
ncbi:hypothetical protein L602_000700000590 [Cupriavidus gilardii J11]|uniref:Uncharacterized protein n=1 Tax=Cupriavidus gilardii J11 TaxID=936133 RepID=A0A562B2A1_9BURK|nr:hypothetical protein L602_000700000590 [Cupriavidus gilardii J11]